MKTNSKAYLVLAWLADLFNIPILCFSYSLVTVIVFLINRVEVFSLTISTLSFKIYNNQASINKPILLKAFLKNTDIVTIELGPFISCN